MKRILLLFCTVVVGLLSCLADPPKTDPIRLQPTEPKEVRPESPAQSAIYCMVENQMMIIYSYDSMMGEIVVTDAATGEAICYDYAELSGGYSLILPTEHPYHVEVAVGGLTYFCDL